MKSILKHCFFILSLSVLFSSVSFAQEQAKAPFLISAKSKSNGENLHGKLVGVNDTAIVVADKKNALHYLAFSKISLIRIDKNKSDLGIGLVTGALVVGNIVLATNIDEVFEAVLVGTAGTLAIAGVMTVVHGIIHPPVLKLREKDTPFTHDLLVQKLTPYLVKVPSKP